MSSSGGVYSTLLPIAVSTVRELNPKVLMKLTSAYTVFGEYFKVGSYDFPAKPEDLEFGKMFWELSRCLLEEGKVKVHRVALDKYGTGFQGVMKGMDALRRGEVSGEKLVFTV